MNKNFLPEQYESTEKLTINHNYLTEQFRDFKEISLKVEEVVKRGDFTLGRAVDEFEKDFAKLIGVKHAIGVGSGTDALFLSLKALGIGEGDEVITTAFTFYATVGAIVTSGAKPVFVDVKDDYNIDPTKVESAITKRTKAIIPVHWAGKPCQMDRLQAIADKFDVHIVEDSCHAIQAKLNGRGAGSFGAFGCFSLHPLKNLNVWGDGGLACTNSDELANKMRLLRNHGLTDRDTCSIFAYNSRLDTVQAVVGSHLLTKLELITESRIRNAEVLDKGLSSLSQVVVPPRDATTIKQVYHIYSLCFEKRDELQKFLISKGIDAKVHYPVPMHLQPAAATLGYKKGDFPEAEFIASRTLSLPVHEFIGENELSFMIKKIKEFYN